MFHNQILSNREKILAAVAAVLLIGLAIFGYVKSGDGLSANALLGETLGEH